MAHSFKDGKELRSRAGLGSAERLLHQPKGALGFAQGAWLWARLDRRTRHAVLDARRCLVSSSPRKSDVIRAASGLVAVGLMQQALQLFMTFDLPKEAADLLKTLGDYRAAAKLYGRARIWLRAEACFMLAGDKLGAAYCAAQLGRFEQAAGIYEAAGEIRTAAVCLANAKLWRRAAALYVRSGLTKDALNAYLIWQNSDPLAATTKLDEVEINGVITVLSEGRFEPVLVKLLNHNNQVPGLLRALLLADRLELAAEIYGVARDQLREDVLAWGSGEASLAEPALAMLRRAADKRGEGLLLGRLERWSEALDAFEMAGDLDAACSACVKAELWERLAPLKLKKQIASQSWALGSPSALAHSTLSQPGIIALESRLAPLPAELPPSLIFEPQIEQPWSNPAAKMAAEVGFANAPFYAALAPEVRQTLWQAGMIRNYEKGRVLVDFDDMPLGTLTVLSGHVSIMKRLPSGHDQVVDRAGPGETLGESWSLMSMKAGVRLLAEEDCVIHMVGRDALSDVLSASPKAAERLYSGLASSLVKHLVRRIAPGAGPSVRPD